MTIIFYFSLAFHQTSWLGAQGSKHLAHLELAIHSISDRARNVHSDRTSKTHLSSPLLLQLNKSGLRKHHVSRVTCWVWDESRTEITRPVVIQQTLHYTLPAVWLATGPVTWFLPSDTFLPQQHPPQPTSLCHLAIFLGIITIWYFMCICVFISSLSVSVHQNINSTLARSRYCPLLYLQGLYQRLARDWHSLFVKWMNKWTWRTNFPKGLRKNYAIMLILWMPVNIIWRLTMDNVFYLLWIWLQFISLLYLFYDFIF